MEREGESAARGDYELVIPVLRLEACPALPALLAALDGQERRPRAVHIVAGDSRQGRAINFGVRQAAARFVGTLDDDSVVDDPRLFAKLLDCLAADPSVGMAGAACEIPAWASPFQRRAMREIPRRSFPRQERTVDSDMVQHPCLLMPRGLFLSVGGEDEDLIRGLDPVLRKKVRDAGRRVVVAADTWVYHLLPDGWGRLVAMYYRNGRGSGYAQAHHPERVLELTDGHDGGRFVERRGLPWRATRRAAGLLGALLRGRLVLLATSAAYGAGVVRERLLPAPASAPRAVRGVDTERRGGHAFPLLVHRVRLAP